MAKRKYFGTDGIRGRVGQFPISPDWVLKLGWALGRRLAEDKRGRVLIGKDTRISGYIFESALEAGLASAGMDVQLLGPMPTPAVAYLTRTLGARAGIVISASHNHFTDNGIKFFSHDGFKFSDETELAIEAMIDEPLVTVEPEMLGKASRVVDAPGRYIEFCKSAFDAGSLNGFKIVLDCANGATYHIAPHVFSELGADVITICNNPDGKNINDNCGTTHPSNLAKAVIDNKADIGISFDGDGDRVLMVDNKGNIIDGDALLFLLTKFYRSEYPGLNGVVGTVMSNLGLEQAISDMGLNFIRAKVGDRYVLEQLKKHSLLLGGESSGHLICLDTNTTGDGIVSALRVLSYCVSKDKPIAELLSDYKQYPQTLKNVSASKEVVDNPKLKTAVSKITDKLGSRGRILLRASGTEPVVRVMVEANSKDLADSFADDLALEVEKHALK